MGGIVALVLAFLAFMVPLAIPLFIIRWRTFIVVAFVATLFFWWLNGDIANAPGGGMIGPFLGGLMLVGFGAGALAKLVMLISRREGPAP